MQAIRVLFIAAFAAPLDAQLTPLAPEPGITPPRVLHKVDLGYSADARAAHIQGNVVLQLTVNETGRVANMRVISPLGHGLDEKAMEAVAQWDFAPAQKDGHAISSRATVELKFRLFGFRMDEGFERRRTEFNLAQRSLFRPGTPAYERSVKIIQDLAKQKFPAALYMVGMWEIKGQNVPRDALAGMEKIRKAADKKYAPALYQVAAHAIDDASDADASWEKMRQAAVLGSREAQFFLGDHYERGDGVEQSVDRAKNYFRLCGAKGEARCQYRMARLMFNAPDRQDYEYEQALAWFQLAAANGIRDARQVLDQEKTNLNPAQERAVAKLTRQFVGKFE
jgi:TonB family protein